jgi:hypothetical protein
VAWLSPSQVETVVGFLPVLQVGCGVLAFLFSVIVRWRNRRRRDELYTHIEVALAGAAIPTGLYLVFGAFVPELLASLPGLRYYIGIIGAVTVFIAVSRLSSATP